MIISNALELIGKTPLISLERIYKGPGKIYAKAEFLQPGGSVKDRAALQITFKVKFNFPVIQQPAPSDDLGGF